MASKGDDTSNSIFADNSVFLLGSGFSRSFCSGMPVLSDLSSKLSEDEGVQRFPHLHEFLQTFGTEKPGDAFIEHIVTLLFSGGPYTDRNQENLFRVAGDEFLVWLSEEIRAENVIESPLVFSRFLAAVSTEERERPRIRIVTLNYDDLIERQLLEMSREHFRNGCWYSDSVVPIDDLQTSKTLGGGCASNRMVPAIKLHGSVDWYRIAGADKNDIQHVIHPKQESNALLIHRKDPPVIVPMAHARSIFLGGTLFPVLWRYAIAAFEMADTIHAIGYGFPETDLRLLFELQRFKDKVRTIVVKETNQDNLQNVRARLENLFPHTTIINEDAKSFLEVELDRFDDQTQDD